MVQNLDLDLSTSVALTNQNTDLNSKASWTPQNSTQTTEGTNWSYDISDNMARSMDPGNIYLPGGVGTGTADANNNLAGSTTGEPWEHIGNYYNWYAATAGTGTAAMVAPATASDSICPKGWKLPDNEGSKSFVNLIFTTYGLIDNNMASVNKASQIPLNFTRLGTYNAFNGLVSNRGKDGMWWTTTAFSPARKAISLTIAESTTRVIPQHSDDKGYGFSIRCVAR